MTKSMQADLFFQICIQDFSEAFGIQDPSLLEAQKREIVPEYVEIDTVVSFPDDFDFTTLQDRIFPFWGKENVIEYKALNDRLSPMHLGKYSLTELGIMTTHLLSKPRKDRKEHQPLSQKEAKAQAQRLTAQGAQHTCCNTILTTADPVGLRTDCDFEPVDAYEHLQGALYRHTIWKNSFMGDVAVYLVVVNDLPIHPKNAPLLLLSTGTKQTEFCRWLLDTHEDITILEQQRYLTYLVTYELIENQEVRNKMTRQIQMNVSFLVDLYNRGSDEEQNQFIRQISRHSSPIKVAQAALQADSPVSAAQTMLQVDSPLDVAQIALQADSPLGVAQAALQVDSPLGVAQAVLKTDSPMGVAQAALQADSPEGAAQAVLQTDSPEEAAAQLIQNQEQMNRVLELFLQRNKAQNGDGATDEESTVEK